MKRTATNDEHSSSNHELIVDNGSLLIEVIISVFLDYDDYSQQDSGRSSYPVSQFSRSLIFKFRRLFDSVG